MWLLRTQSICETTETAVSDCLLSVSHELVPAVASLDTQQTHHVDTTGRTHRSRPLKMWCHNTPLAGCRCWSPWSRRSSPALQRPHTGYPASSAALARNQPKTYIQQPDSVARCVCCTQGNKDANLTVLNIATSKNIIIIRMQVLMRRNCAYLLQHKNDQ